VQFLLWVAGAYVAVSFFGYWVHRALHAPWSGVVHRGHMRHHLDLYPPGRLVSPRYDHARWWESGTFLFAPPLAIVVVAALLAGAPWYAAAAMLGFALLSDAVHDGFHLDRPGLQRFAAYRRLRGAHFAHHLNMRRNYGILTLVWDRLFGTVARRA
jgi:sterol desaturase/sphingolipid hydroxylase (fatty acid hydroxylase superfamily)